MVRFIKPDKHIIGPLIHRLQDRLQGHPEPPALPITMESVSAVELVHELRGLAKDKRKWLARLDELETEGYIPQLIFIDAGLVTSLNEKNRRDFLDLFQAIAEFDGYRAGKLMVERCRHPELTIDDETFALKIQHVVLSVKSKTFSLAKIKISDILGDVLTAVRQHHVKLEGDFVNTVISVLLLEGIGRQLDPDMDLFKSALPILRQLGRQMSPRDAISTVNRGNIWAMAKLWIYAEARTMAGSVSLMDKFVKYDLLSPNV
jgi:aarF domain-containing kinase